jgi:polyphenol oxidase
MIEVSANTAYGTARLCFIGNDARFKHSSFEGQYDLLLQAFPNLARLAYAEQVHGKTSVALEMPTQGIINCGQADALYTTAAQTAVLIRTADCIPILAYHAEKPFVAAIHAGWRGLKLGILSALLTQPEHTELRLGLRFVVGPFIQEKSYEVGAEVASEFSADCSIGKSNGKYLLNLRAIIAAEFNALGVPSHNIQWHARDTFSDSDWYSARRGATERNLALAFWMS